ncbi:MAG TPA: YciI family protein [Puia sp.]|nr:YciI family protein [Puia sp.]
MQARMAAFNEWVQKVLDGRFVGGAPLEDSEARLLKSRTEIVTDGPFLESKEMISGYMIINAENVEEATRLTSECPLLGEFRLEVRKLKPMA